MIRDHGHVLALEQAAMAATSPAPPHRAKVRIPPGPDALAAAQALRRNPTSTTNNTTDSNAGGTAGVVIDLAAYAAAAAGRNTLTP